MPLRKINLREELEKLKGSVMEECQEIREKYNRGERTPSDRVTDIDRAEELMGYLTIIENDLRAMGCPRKELEFLEDAWKFLSAYT